MTKKKRKINLKRFKEYLPYILIGLITLLLVAIGSIDKRSAGVNLSLDTFSAGENHVSVDQLSELYVVADLSDVLGLASANDVASNYVIANTMYSTGQTSSGKLEKPPITNISISRGIEEYEVEDGETVETIATKFGLTSDQVRWSNGLKNNNVSAGTILYIPRVSGIVYTVKSGDTIDSIVDKYGSSRAEIIAYNNLENSDISEGMRIIIKDGSLPETERPEYVAPVTVRYTYTYLGNTSERQNLREAGWLYIGGGQCVDYALYKRPDLKDLYGYSLGNANTWASNAIYSVVNRTPAPGAIFQTSSGWFGHVGYVESVNPDGSIEVSEMNYNYVPYRIVRATIPADVVGNFFYIH